LTTLQKQRCISQQNHAKPIKNRQEVLSAKGCAFLVVAAGDNWFEALSAAQSSLKDTITKWVLPRGSRIEGVKDVKFYQHLKFDHYHESLKNTEK